MSTAAFDWQDFHDRIGHWRVRADWKEVLLGRGNSVDLGQVLCRQDTNPPGRQVIKHAAHRLIYREDTPQGPIYVKHYFVRGLRAWLRSCLRPPKAFLECDRALALLARDVPTVEPLAAFAHPDGSSCIITRSIEDSLPLDRLLKEQRLSADIPWQRQLTQELAAFVARLHDAGVSHQDFHPGNILVRTDEFGLPEWFLIDPYEVRLGEPLDLHASCANLVQFALWFLPRTSSTDRLRFWRYYWLERQGRSLEIAAAERELLPQLERDLWRTHLQRWRQREHRYLSDNRDFYRLRHGNNRAWAVRDLPPEVLTQLLSDPDAPFSWEHCRLLKNSPSSTVAEVDLAATNHVTNSGGREQQPSQSEAVQRTDTDEELDGPGSFHLQGGTAPYEGVDDPVRSPTAPGGQLPTVIYKRFRVTKCTDPLLHIFRDSPALKSWRNGQRLLEVGLPTARPLAVLHRRGYGLTWDCYLLTEKLENATELKAYVDRLHTLSTVDAHRQRRVLLEQVARLLRRLHRHQVSHRDLKAANILVVDAPCTDSPQLFFIDLYGMKRWRKLPRAQRLQNLMRLFVSFLEADWLTPSERLRFLRVYLCPDPVEAARWKVWWREIAALTARKVAQNTKRQRPLS